MNRSDRTRDAGESVPEEDRPDARVGAPDADLLRPLMKLSNLIGRPFFSHFADRYDLTRNDVRVLMGLADMSEGAAHELCRVTGMHPMNVSRSVARLRRQGRIVERSDPLNRRRKILTPTPAGWDLDAKLRPHLKVLADFLFDSMSELEAEFLGKLVKRLVERLEAVDLNSPLLLDAGALAKDIKTDVEASADGPPTGRAYARSRKALSKSITAGRRASQRPAG